MTEEITFEEFFAPKLSRGLEKAKRAGAQSKKMWNTYCIRENRARLLLVALVVALGAVIVGRVNQANSQDKVREAWLMEAQASFRPAAEEVIYLEAPAMPDPMQIEAETVARVLYGTARDNTQDQQEAVVWCIINRTESALYPDTIDGVCRQEGQWMGYSDSNPILEDLYQTAYGVLEDYYGGGHRIVPPEMLWLSWDPGQITLRDNFTEAPGTKYWRA